jgi:hypothetical protein
MANANGSRQDLNQAFLYYNTTTSGAIVNTSWALDAALGQVAGLLPVVTSPLSTEVEADWLGLHKMALEFSYLQLPAILVSPLLVVTAMLMSELACRLVFTHVLPGLVRSFLLDFLAAGEASFLSWELLTLFHAYGLPVWTVATYLTLVGKAYRYRADCVACPYSHLLSCLGGQLAWRQAFLRIGAQLLAGSTFFRLVAAVWDLGLTPIHVSRSYWMAYGHCASWLEVATWAGLLYESGGTLVCGLAAGLIFDPLLWPSLSLHVRILSSCFVTLTAVLAAFFHTGGFFQPLLAYTRTFGCVGVLRRVELLDHVLVYWVGATSGAVAAMYMLPLLRRLLMWVSSGRLAELQGDRRMKSKEEEALAASRIPELENQHAHNT